MALKRVEIKELKGVNLNAVEGVTQQQPATLKSFDFDKGGGYRAFRGQETLSISGSFAGAVVGFDDAGYVSLRAYGSSTSFPRGEVTMRVYDGTSTVQEVVDGFDATSTSTPQITTSSSALKPVHFESTGLYVYPGDRTYAGVNDSTNQSPLYLLKDAGGTWRNSVDTLSMSFSGTPSAVVGTEALSPVILFGAFATEVGTFLWPLDQLATSDFNECSVSTTYTNAPDKWMIYGFAERATASGFGATRTTGVYYEIRPADSSGSTDFTIYTSASSQSISPIFSGGKIIGAFTPPVVHHRERVYGTFNRSVTGKPGANEFFYNLGTSLFSDLVPRLPMESTVWYTDIGYANMWSPESYVTIPLSASAKITGLAPSPAGLLIFGDNETFLARSDPALSDFAVQLVSGVIGCDDGVSPVRLGGVVFTIYKGEIYAISLGMGDVDFGSGITKISDPVYLPSDPFTTLASEADYRYLVAKTGSLFYRFDAGKKEWITDVYDASAGVNLLFSNPDSNGARYYKFTSGTLVGAYGTLDTPTVTWEDVDVRDKDLMKMWRRVRLHTNDGYSGTPELDYVINNTSGTITASDETGGRWTFTLPSGLVNEKAEELTVRLVGAVENDTIEPPVVVEFVERYRRN